MMCWPRYWRLPWLWLEVTICLTWSDSRLSSDHLKICLDWCRPHWLGFFKINHLLSTNNHTRLLFKIWLASFHMA